MEILLPTIKTKKQMNTSGKRLQQWLVSAQRWRLMKKTSYKQKRGVYFIKYFSHPIPLTLRKEECNKKVIVGHAEIK